MHEVIFYCTPRGKNFVMEFIESLPKKAQLRVAGYIKLLATKGTLLRHEYTDILRDKIYELQPSFGKLEIRILYFFHKKDIILTHGFLKKTRAVPKAEIERAKTVRKNYLREQ